MQELLLMPRTSLSGQINFRLAASDMERLEAMARVKGIANSAMAKELMLRALDDETISARGPKSQGATSERPGTEMAELRARLDVVESRLDATLKQLKP